MLGSVRYRSSSAIIASVIANVISVFTALAVTCPLNAPPLTYWVPKVSCKYLCVLLRILQVCRSSAKSAFGVSALFQWIIATGTAVDSNDHAVVEVDNVPLVASINIKYVAADGGDPDKVTVLLPEIVYLCPVL